MGRRGPRPKPTAVRLLDGNAGRRPLNEAEPELPKVNGSAPVPAGLTGAGRLEWTRLLPVLVERGVLTEADLTAFEDFCRALSALRRYEALAKRLGLETAIARGVAGQVLKLRAQVAQLRARLGLDPSSRSQVKAVKGRGTTGESRLSVFLGGKLA